MAINRRSGPRIAGAALAAGVLILGGGVPLTAQTPSRNSQGISADITIRRGQVGGPAASAGAAATVTSYHLEQEPVGAHWRTIMTITSTSRPRVRTKQGTIELDDPTVISRIEDDGDGSAPRLLDRHGKPVLAMPDAVRNRLAALADVAPDDPAGQGGRRASFAPRATASLLFDAGDARGRRTELVRRFGESAARVRGLDRFLATRGARSTEVLVDPGASLPMEINVVENGALRAHTTFEYAAVGGRIARTHIHAERLASAQSGVRITTDVEVSNIRMTTAGAK